MPEDPGIVHQQPQRAKLSLYFLNHGLYFSHMADIRQESSHLVALGLQPPGLLLHLVRVTIHGDNHPFLGQHSGDFQANTPAGPGN